MLMHTDTVLSIEGAGTIDLTDAALTAGDGNDLEFSGVFNGANDFTKVGSGTLTLSGDNATASYTGRVIIDDGVVSVAADSNLGDPDTLDADRLILKGGTLSASSNFTLDTNRGITLSTGGGTINVVSGRTLTYGGVIDGTSTFYKSGAGTLILSGTNTNTGSTSITAGTLRVTGALDDTAVSVSSGATYDVDATDAVANISGEGTVDIASGVTLTVGSNNLSTTLSGVISGDGNLIKVGTGRITLSGANDYTGSTTVSAGYLRAQHNTALGTTAGNTNVANGATLELIGGITIGSGEDLTIIGDGMSDGNYLGALRNVSGTNTYQGSITLSTSTSRIVSSDGTLNVSGNIINGSIDLIITGSGDTSISGVIGNGSGALSKRGSGILTLSGTNTYTGITTISAGTLSISADAGLGSISSLDADRLTFNGGTLLITETITLNTNRGITLSTDGGTINVANTKTVTYDGVITGSTAFTKDGNGVLDLGGTNTYTGATTISDGTLQITGALDATALTVSSGATYDSDTTDTIGSIHGAGNIEINSGTTLTVGGNNTETTVSGVISGAGNLIKEGTDTLTLSGTNTYTGDTTVNNGAITVSGSGKLGNGNYAATLVVAASKTFTYSSSSAQTFSDWGAGTGTINLSGGDTVTLSGDQNFTGTLNVSQMLAMTNGTNGSETGLGKATTIDIQSGGTIKVQSSDNGFIGYQTSGAPDIYIRDGGELTTDDTDTARTFHIGGTLTLDGGTLSWEEGTGNTISTADGTWNFDQDVVVTDDSTISAPALLSKEADGDTTFTVSATKTLTVSGYFYDASAHTEVAVEKAGDGTMILQAAGTHPAAFTVTAGTLAVTANNALGTTAAETTVASGATLDFRGVTYSTTEAITNNGGTIATSTGTSTFAGVITLGANSTFDVNEGAELTASGVIQDGANTYGITKNGDGKLILSGANTYDGTTTISNGSLRAADDDALGNTTGNTTVADGAALELIGGITIASGEDLTLNGTGEDSTGALRNISGDNTYNGNITLSTNAVRINSDSGTLTIGGTISNGSIGLTFGGAGDITVNGVIGNGAGTVTKDGAGTLTLTADNTYTGLTTVSDGILAISHVNALGATAGASVVASGATLSISNGINVPEPITISGTGDSSVGAIRFTGGANTYSGAIILGANATISSTGTGGTTFSGTINATSNGGQSLTISTSTDDLTISGVIGGTYKPSSISISATGVARTLSIDQDLSSTGNQTLTAAGGITISGARTFTSTSGTINTVSALSGNSSFDISGNADIDGAITGITTFSVSGTSDLGNNITTSSTQTYTGAVTLSADVTLTGTVINTQSTIGSAVTNISAQGLNGWTNNAGTSLSSPTITYNDGTNGSETILAGFNNIVKYSEVTGLGGQSVTVTFNWYRIDSWDGVEPLKIIVNDTQIFNSTFTSLETNKSQTTSGYTTTFVNRKSNGDRGNYAAYINSQSTWLDQSFLVTITTPAINSFALKIDADNMQDANDESYGVRDFALSGGVTPYALTIDGNLNANAAIGGLTTLSVTGTSSLNGDVTSSSTQDYSGNVTIDNDITLTTTDSQITFTGTVNSQATEANDLTISVGTSEVEFDSAVGGSTALGAISITGDLDLDADITSASSLSVSADTNLAADVTTSGTQTYGDDAASDATVTDGSRTLQGSTVQFASTVTGTTAATDDLTITGALNLDGAITDINDLYVSGTSDLGANITTTGTQEYNNNVTLSGAARTLTTSGDTVTFTGTVNGAQDLTVDTNGTDNSSSLATVLFSSTVGDTTKVGAIIITGNLDLDGNIIKTSDSTAGATSINVSGTSNLGADVTTTGSQTYTGAVTLS